MLRSSLSWQHLQVLGLKENSSYGEPQCILVSLCNMVALDVATVCCETMVLMFYCVVAVYS